MSFGSNTDGQARGASTVNAVSARAMKYRRRRGGFIIIWGSRSSASPDPMVAPSYRACPGCRQKAQLVGMISRRWFTFFFCPIFPIGSDRRYVQCSTCGGKFTGVNMPLAAGAMAGPPLAQVAGALPGQQSAPSAAMTPPPPPKAFTWIWVAVGVPLLVVVVIGAIIIAGMVKGLRAARAAAANARNTTMVNQSSPAQGSQWSPPPHPEIQSTADALEAMNSHDIDWGNRGYDWLKRSDVDPANRPAVLKYLRPFLTPNPADPNEYGNQVDRIDLFCKWADSACQPELLTLLDADFHDNRPAEASFRALARLAPDVAETELHKRRTIEKKPYIRNMLSGWRRSSDPALVAFMARIEPEIRTGADAVAAMAADDIDRKNKAYELLKQANIDPASRPAVLNYLRKFLSPKQDAMIDYRAQMERVDLFCKWADNSCTPDLLALLDADFRDVHPAESAFASLARVAPDVAETELRKRWQNETKPFIPGMLSHWRRSNDPALSSEGSKMEAEFVAWRDDRKKTADATRRAQDAAAAAGKRAKEESDRALTPEHMAEWLESTESNKRRDAFAALAKVEIPAAQRDRIHKALCAIATGDKMPGIRRDAARYLADFGQPADIPLLTAMANEPDAGKLYTSVPAASAMLLDPVAGLKIIDAHSSERRYADNVANELAHHGEKAERAGLAMLKSSDPETRHAALNLLGKVGTKASLAKVKAAQAVESDKKLLGHYKSTIKDIEKR